MRFGPVWRQYPTTTTTGGTAWCRCYIWLDWQGQIFATEWLDVPCR